MAAWLAIALLMALNFVCSYRFYFFWFCRFQWLLCQGLWRRMLQYLWSNGMVYLHAGMIYLAMREWFVFFFAVFFVAEILARPEISRIAVCQECARPWFPFTRAPEWADAAWFLRQLADGCETATNWTW
jgi:hypothetical protein